MGDVMDSTLMHANKGKAPVRLNFKHSRLLARVLV